MNRLELAKQQPLYEWETPEGRLVERSSVNRHHVSWANRNYKTQTEKRYRNMAGMVLPLLVTEHRELHAHIKPPPKPSHALMQHAIAFNSAIDMRTDVYGQFEQMIEFFADIGDMSQRVSESKTSRAIAANFVLQEAFVSKGQVKLA